MLDDYGCLHFKFPIILGISSPTYSNAQLKEFKKDDNKTFEFDGKEYTMYEATQIQGKLETAARHAKDRQIMAKSADDDTLRRAEQAKINAISSKYAKFSKEAGLPTKVERMSVAGFRKVKTQDELTKNHLKNSAGHDILKVSKTKLTGVPNSITQVINEKGGIDRNYYGESGRQFKQISNNDHDHKAERDFGNHGEHGHDYYFDENGKLKHGKARELNADERKENDDIL